MIFFDKDFNLINEIEKYQIKCFCNDNISVFSSSGLDYYFDINTFKFIDSGHFLQWISSTAFEYEDNKLIIKDMRSKNEQNICILCNVKIIDTCIQYEDNKFHKSCLDKLKLVST